MNGITTVMATYNRFPFLKLTIDSIRRELKTIPHEIIVIDGGSIDGTLKWLLKQKDILSIIQHNHGLWKQKPVPRMPWGYFMNLGFKCSKGKYICMLSDDCLIVPGSIENGLRIFEEELGKGRNIGAVAFYWRNWPDQEKYRVGLTLGGHMFVNHGMYLKKAVEKVDYFDEDAFSFYHADGDLCLKMWQQGYVCIDSPDSYIEHYSHANINLRKANLSSQPKDWDNYLKKWEGIFYYPGKENYGSWKEKKYADPAKTAMQFDSIKLLKYTYRNRISKRFFGERR